MEYPDRVTQGEDGAYRWTCKIDKKYEHRQYSLTMWVVGICCLICLGMTAVFGFDEASLRTVVLSVLAAMFICQMVCRFLEKLPGTVDQKYELTDKHIRLGEGTGTATIELDKVEKVIVYGDALELYGKFGNPMVFVPVDDYDMVKDKILTLTSEKAKVEYR